MLVQVDFTKIGIRASERGYDAKKWEADFALNALMEIPEQYKIIRNLGLLGKKNFNRPLTLVNVVPINPVGNTENFAPNTH
jgi:hypothetical protein